MISDMDISPTPAEPQDVSPQDNIPEPPAVGTPSVPEEKIELLSPPREQLIAEGKKDERFAGTPAQSLQTLSRRTAERDAIFHIEIEKIHPNAFQPRRHFDEAALRDLAASIRDFGF